MKCPLCESDNVQTYPLFRVCVDCGASTSLVFNPKGDEPDLPKLIDQLWTKKVLGFITPLEKRPTFTWSASDKWSVTLDIFPEPFVSLHTPDEGIALCVAAFQVARGITPDRYAQIKTMYEEEMAKDPDKAAEDYVARAERIARWAQRVEEMGEL